MVCVSFPLRFARSLVVWLRLLVCCMFVECVVLDCLLIVLVLLVGYLDGELVFVIVVRLW